MLNKENIVKNLSTLSTTRQHSLLISLLVLLNKMSLRDFFSDVSEEDANKTYEKIINELKNNKGGESLMELKNIENISKKSIIVNLFGEPSSGKSTAAAYIFSQLKINGVSCEYVHEFAKDKLYEENKEVFKHQEYIFGKQNFNLGRVDGKVDVVITDSPILLSIIYNRNPYLKESFNQTVLDMFNSYNNYNFMLTREHLYETEGRFEPERDAEFIRNVIINTLNKYNINYTQIKSNQHSYDKIVDDILEKLTRK